MVHGSEPFNYQAYVFINVSYIQHPEREFLICTSYLEIYNEVSLHVNIIIMYVCTYVMLLICDVCVAINYSSRLSLTY